MIKFFDISSIMHYWWYLFLVIHFPISSRTSLNLVTWLNILFPIMSYNCTKKLTTCGINSALYYSISLFSRGNTCLNNNCFLSLWMSYTFYWSLLSKYMRDFGKLYRIPWQRFWSKSWIYNYSTNVDVHFYAIYLTYTLALLNELKMLVQITPKLFYTNFCRG